ncbi:MAG: 5'-3' exonuclease H3TH domain-containing protein, partial [Kangiellaceae bacterium]
MTTDNNQPLILVDGSSYLFRAYHSMSQAGFTNSKGQPTGAIYGVVNMLKSLCKQYDSQRIAVIFDAKGKTFRNDIYPEYKANRPPMPDDLRSQIEPLHNIIRALGFPIYAVEGVEADDVIGTVSRIATEQGQETVISTGDKDMAQLVNQHVSLINTMTNEFLDIEGVKQKFEIPPERIIDFLGLMGDKVDNIPGVAGVGKKTALGLIQGIGGIDEIYNNLDKIADLPIRGAKKLAEKMTDNEDQARLSYELATIALDVEVPFDIDELHIQAPDKELLEEYYKEYEFRTWLKNLKAGQPPLPSATTQTNSAVEETDAIAAVQESSIDHSQ